MLYVETTEKHLNSQFELGNYMNRINFLILKWMWLVLN